MPYLLPSDERQKLEGKLATGMQEVLQVGLLAEGLWRYPLADLLVHHLVEERDAETHV